MVIGQIYLVVKKERTFGSYCEAVSLLFYIRICSLEMSIGSCTSISFLFFTLFLSIFVVGKRSISCMTWGKNNIIQNEGLKERLNFVANQMMGLDL